MAELFIPPMDPEYTGSDEAWPEEAIRRMGYDVGFLDAPPREPDALDRVLETTALIASASAERLRAIDDLRREAWEQANTGRGVSRDHVERSLRLELAAAMRVTERSAEVLLERADALVTRYPAALGALSSGAITERHADLYADAMDELDPHQREQVADKALAMAQQQPTGTYRRWLAKVVDSMRAPTMTERHEEATTHRG